MITDAPGAVFTFRSFGRWPWDADDDLWRIEWDWAPSLVQQWRFFEWLQTLVRFSEVWPDSHTDGWASAMVRAKRSGAFSVAA